MLDIFSHTEVIAMLNEKGYNVIMQDTEFEFSGPNNSVYKDTVAVHMVKHPLTGEKILLSRFTENFLRLVIRKIIFKTTLKDIDHVFKSVQK